MRHFALPEKLVTTMTLNLCGYQAAGLATFSTALISLYNLATPMNSGTNFPLTAAVGGYSVAAVQYANYSQIALYYTCYKPLGVRIKYQYYNSSDVVVSGFYPLGPNTAASGTGSGMQIQPNGVSHFFSPAGVTPTNIMNFQIRVAEILGLTEKQYADQPLLGNGVAIPPERDFYIVWAQQTLSGAATGGTGYVNFTMDVDMEFGAPNLQVLS